MAVYDELEGSAGDEQADRQGADAFWNELTQQPKSQKLGQACAAGVAAAALCVAVWIAVASVTGMELGIVALALGALVGLAVGEVAAYRSKKVEAAAVGIVIVAFFVTKLLMAVIAAPTRVALEIAADPELFHNIQVNDRLFRGEAPPAVIEWYDSAPDGAQPPPELLAQIEVIDDEIAVAVHRMSDEQREAFARRYIDKTISTIPWSKRIRFSLFDIIWFVLAMTATRRVASGAFRN